MLSCPYFREPPEADTNSGAAACFVQTLDAPSCLLHVGHRVQAPFTEPGVQKVQLARFDFVPGGEFIKLRQGAQGPGWWAFFVLILLDAPVFLLLGEEL